MNKVEIKDCTFETGEGAAWCGACRQAISFIRGMDCGRPDCAMKQMGDALKAIGQDALKEAIQRMREGETGPD